MNWVRGPGPTGRGPLEGTRSKQHPNTLTDSKASRPPEAKQGRSHRTWGGPAAGDTATQSSRSQASPRRWEKTGIILAFETVNLPKALVWLTGWKILRVKIQIRIIALES